MSESRLLAYLPLAAAALRHRAAGAISDPVAWIEHRLGEQLWSKQAQIARSVAANRSTAVQSCHDSGKSFVASRIVAWWLDTHRIGEAFVVTTAPSLTQVRTILWREIGRAHAKGHLPGRVNQTEWWFDEELVAFGRKPADYDPAAFQGIHAAAVLVVIDEACGVPKSLWDAASTLLTNEASRILAIGNPDDPGSYFAAVCRPGSGWNVLRISAADTPNFTGEPIDPALGKLLISPVWVDERRAEWGAGSALYRSKIEGEFPDSADDGVIPYSSVRAAQLDPVALPQTPVELGVDLGAGGDETVIFERRGGYPGRRWRDHGADAMAVTGKIVRAIKETGASAVKIDVIGIGWGVHGRLVELGKQGVHTARIVGVNVGERSSDPTRFPRLRDELWWVTGRELIGGRGIDLSDLDDAVVAQLVAPRYAIDSAGRVKIEPKAETRLRLGRSPDDADALLLAFYVPPDREPGLITWCRAETARLRAARLGTGQGS
jgi:hypothetical protein